MDDETKRYLAMDAVANGLMAAGCLLTALTVLVVLAIIILA